MKKILIRLLQSKKLRTRTIRYACAGAVLIVFCSLQLYFSHLIDHHFSSDSMMSNDLGTSTVFNRRQKNVKEQNAVLVVAHVEHQSLYDMLEQLSDSLVETESKQFQVFLFKDETKNFSNLGSLHSNVAVVELSEERIFNGFIADKFETSTTQGYWNSLVESFFASFFFFHYRQKRRLRTFYNHNLGQGYLPLWAMHYRYDYYWMIEQDVRFTGNWTSLFNTFTESKADLISHERANWGSAHWRRCSYCISHNHQLVNTSQAMTAFMPFCRLSWNLVQEVNLVLRQGLTGHHELFIYWICKHNSWCLNSAIPISILGPNYSALSPWNATQWRRYLKSVPMHKNGIESEGQLLHPIKEWII